LYAHLQGIDQPRPASEVKKSKEVLDMGIFVARPTRGLPKTKKDKKKASPRFVEKGKLDKGVATLGTLKRQRKKMGGTVKKGALLRGAAMGGTTA